MPASFDRPREPPTDPSPWFQRFAHLIPPGTPALDLACGNGRHSRWLLARGHAVVAADLVTTGVADLAGIPGAEILTADLEAATWPLAGRRFGAVLVANYLYRPRFPELVAALLPDGVLLVDTFGQGNEALGRPRNPDFLLAPGELLDLVRATLAVVAYEYGTESTPRPAVRQRICARRGSGPAALSP